MMAKQLVYRNFMNKSTYFIVFLMFIGSILYSYNLKAQIQLSGRVIDSETKKGLPFVNIMLYGESMGTTSNLAGEYSLTIHDTLLSGEIVFSYIGYRPKNIKTKSLIDQQLIQLNRENIDIPEVIVKNKAIKRKTIVIDKIREKTSVLRYSKSPFDSTGNLNIPYRPKEPAIQAKFFSYNEKYKKSGMIKHINLYLMSNKDSIVTFRVRLFQVNSDGSPGNDLLLTPLIIELTESKSIVTVNVSDKGVIMPEKGIFVGFELLILPENKTIIRNNVGIEADVYLPFLYLTPSENIGEYWIYSGGKWSMSKYWYFREGYWEERDVPNYRSKNVSGPYIYKPAISLVLH